MTDAATCACPCGHVTYRVHGAPKLRMLCHCTLCRKFNETEVSDVLVYDDRQVERPAQGAVNFEALRPPPNVQRGRCAKCGAPAIEVFEAPLFPKLIMVPTTVHSRPESLPEPCGRFFYGSRLSDATDALPRYSGYLPSQLAFFRHYLAGRLRGDGGGQASGSEQR